MLRASRTFRGGREVRSQLRRHQARRPAFGIDDPRHGVAHPDDAAVAAQVALVELEPLGSTGQDVLENAPVLRGIVGVSQVEDRLLEQLRLAIADEPQEGGVGADVAARGIGDRDAVRRAVEGRREQLSPLALELARRHVAHHVRVGLQHACFVAQRGDRDLGP